MFDWELLATYHAAHHFQLLIKDHRCMLFIDLHSLTQAIHCHMNPWSPNQQCHLSAIAEPCCDVLYQLGPLNTMLDCLSHTAVSAITFGVDYNQLAALQSTFLDIQALPL